MYMLVYVVYLCFSQKTAYELRMSVWSSDVCASDLKFLKSDEGGAAIRVENLSKTFMLHVQGGTRLPVFSRLSLEVAAGECVALYGPSGSGKSTLLRSLYANYKPGNGHV